MTDAGIKLKRYDPDNENKNQLVDGFIRGGDWFEEVFYWAILEFPKGVKE